MTKIATVCGEIDSSALGRTLMHEHLVIGYPGFQSHTTRPGPSRDEMFAVCVDRIESLKALGFSSMLDPCPSDLGRDVELAARVARATGFNIIVATGLYKQSEGGVPYWHFRSQFGPIVDEMAALFVHELTEGIGDTGIRAGIIKVATGLGRVTDYERSILLAAAKASVETGAPITTHTDQGTLGDEQQAILTGAGVPAHRIVIGHSCGTGDHAYHMKLARGGSYLGFDRFGIDALFPDETRVESLVKAIRAGAGDRIVVSHDSVWCWRGEPFPPEILASFATSGAFDPTHFSRTIVPRLEAAGIRREEIERLLVDNPRRFFEGGKLPALA
ncbi:MAG: phosphotriesterase-related protein [Spirochaetaceae bacterium]|nr:phosphotriesterase-related protein [Spirochaetaceae bacterium]HPG24304.1 phosphotriesterase-related protein [Myxococcota bacterium]